MKQVLAFIFKGIAGIAGVVFFFAPITDTGILISLVALVVAIITGVLGSHLSDEEGQSGYWPGDPRSPS